MNKITVSNALCKYNKETSRKYLQPIYADERFDDDVRARPVEKITAPRYDAQKTKYALVCVDILTSFFLLWYYCLLMVFKNCPNDGARARCVAKTLAHKVSAARHALNTIKIYANTCTNQPPSTP